VRVALPSRTGARPNEGVQRIAGGSRWPFVTGLVFQSFVRVQRSLVVVPPATADAER